jgi:general secretion pathway protein L
MNRYTRPVEKFLRWWLGELAGMVPVRVRRFCSTRTRGWTVALEGDEAQLLRRSPQGETVAASFKLSEIAPLSVALPSRGPRQHTSRVRLRLPQRHILHTDLSLPLAAEENLGEVLRFELDRRTPFTAGEVHLAHRIESRDDTAIRVALTLVPRAVVSDAISALEPFGLTPDRLEIPHNGAGEADELPLGDEHASAKRHVTPVRAAIAVAFLCSAVAAYASSGRGSDELDALKRQVDGVKAHAQKAEALRAEIATLEEEQAAAATAGRLRPNELLSQLTHVLPDDTWLDRLRIAQGKLTLAGFSESSSSVIRLLNETSYFEAPGFAAPVTQDGQTGKEQFTITTQLRGGQP